MTAMPARRRASVARSPVPLVVAGFAMLTALALLQIGLAATSLRPSAPTVASDPAATSTRSAVERFYAAIDVVLATGDAEPLDAATDPAFVDHVAAASRAGDRVGLIGDLLARRRADPDLQFDVAAVIVDGDQALAYVQAAPFVETAARQPTTIEALRVRGGVVVERWRDSLGIATDSSTPASDRSASARVPTPTPAERWSGDAVWAATTTPATAAAP